MMGFGFRRESYASRKLPSILKLKALTDHLASHMDDAQLWGQRDWDSITHKDLLPMPAWFRRLQVSKCMSQNAYVWHNSGHYAVFFHPVTPFSTPVQSLQPLHLMSVQTIRTLRLQRSATFP